MEFQDRARNRRNIGIKLCYDGINGKAAVIIKDMKFLVIYAHPETSGHCSYLLEKVKNELEAKKLEYEILDLYKAKYDPALHEDEHYTAGFKKVAEENRIIQEKVKESDWLIFIYPLWWGTMPAILKGLFDRILTARFAYKYEGYLPKKLLKGKKSLVFITSGAPVWYFWVTGNRPKRIIKTDILGFCGIRAKVFQIGKCRRFEEEKKKEIAEVVKKAFQPFL